MQTNTSDESVPKDSPNTTTVTIQTPSSQDQPLEIPKGANPLKQLPSESQKQNWKRLTSGLRKRQADLKNHLNTLKGIIKTKTLKPSKPTIWFRIYMFLLVIWKWLSPKREKCACMETEKNRTETIYKDMTDQEKIHVKSLLLDLGYAFSLYSVPCHRLEEALKSIATYYGVEAYYHISKTELFIRFGGRVNDPSNTVHFVSIKTSSINLSKLCLLDDIASDIAKGACSCEDAKKRIHSVIFMKPEKPWLQILKILIAFTIRSASFMVIVNGSWAEIVSSGVAGLFVGILFLISLKIQVFKKFFSMLAVVISMVTGALGLLAFGSLARVNIVSVSLAVMLFLIPTLDFTVSMSELASNFIPAGTMRLLGGIVVVMQIGFGMMLSYKLVALIPQGQYVVPEVQPFDFWISLLVVPISALCTMIGFQYPMYPIAIVFGILASYAAFFGAKYGGLYLGGNEMGAFIGSFGVGIVGSIYAVLSNHPSIVVNTVGIISLLPGTVTLKSIIALIQSDPTEGVNFLWSTIMILTALIFGLLGANIVFPTKKINYV